MLYTLLRLNMNAYKVENDFRFTLYILKAKTRLYYNRADIELKATMLKFIKTAFGCLLYFSNEISQ